MTQRNNKGPKMESTATKIDLFSPEKVLFEIKRYLSGY